MTDLPERIWVWENRDGLGASRGWNLQTSFDAQEFIRADLAPPTDKVAELVEALRGMVAGYEEYDMPDGKPVLRPVEKQSSWIQRARAALAQWGAGE